MKITSLVLFFTLLFNLLPNLALAESIYIRYKLPIGTRVTEPEVRQCYNFFEYKQLLKMDADLKARDKEVADYKLVYTLLNDNIVNLNTKVRLSDTQLNLANSEITRKDKLVTDLTYKNVKLNEELTKHKRVLRITVGVVSAVVAGLVGGIILSEKL